MEEKIKRLLQTYKDIKKGSENLIKNIDSEFIQGKLQVLDYIIENLEDLLGEEND